MSGNREAEKVNEHGKKIKYGELMGWTLSHNEIGNFLLDNEGDVDGKREASRYPSAVLW